MGHNCVRSTAAGARTHRRTMIKTGSLQALTAAVFCGSALLVIGVRPALAGRCGTPRISGGLHGDCPAVDDPTLPQCPAGTTKVIYDLDKDFPPEPGTTSTSVIHTTLDSPCHGDSKTVDMSGYVIGCWYPPKPGTGCRIVKVLNNGDMCLHLDAEPLGCGGADCENLSVEQVAISNAGAADRFVCPPTNPATSCRSARASKRSSVLDRRAVLDARH